MTEINQTIDINELSAMRVDDLPLLTFKDRQNKLKQNIKYKYLPFKLYHRIRCYKYAKYRNPELKLIKSLVNKDKDSIDIGANLGLFHIFYVKGFKTCFCL